MTLFRRLLRYEAVLFRKDRAAVLLTMVFLLLSLYGVANGARWAHMERTRLRAVQAAQQKATETAKNAAAALQQSGGKAASPFADPTSPGVVGGLVHGGHYALLPPMALAALSIGQSDLRPAYVPVALQPAQDLLSHVEIENPQNLLEGPFDYTFVVVYVLPLFLLGLSYSLLSVDLENGTLALLLAQGVSLWKLVAARVCIRFVVAMGCVVLCCAAGLVAGAGQGLTGQGVTGQAVGYVLLLLIAVATYILFWLVLSVLIQVLLRRSAAGAIVQLAAWVVLVLIAPALINVYATSLHPPPSRIAQIQELRRATTLASGRGAQTLQRFLNDHPDLAPRNANAGMSDYFSSTLAVRTESETLVQPMLDRFTLEREARDRTLQRFRFLSPAIVMRLAMEDVAGTGDARYALFVQQYGRFHKQWHDFFSRRILQQVKFSASDYDTIPAFSFQEESAQAMALQSLASIAGIAFPMLVLASIAGRYLSRFKPIS